MMTQAFTLALRLLLNLTPFAPLLQISNFVNPFPKSYKGF